MKAAILEAFGKALAIDDVPDPKVGTGEVLVNVLATVIPPYAAEIFSGKRRYPLEPPVISGVGAIGRVVATGPDATRLRDGDLVWCDSTVRSRDDALTPDITLQGWSSRGDGGLRLARYFHDGPFAEQMVVPTENAVRSVMSTSPTSRAGRRSGSCWCRTVACWPPVFKRVRHWSSAARPETSAAQESPSDWRWARQW